MVPLEVKKGSLVVLHGLLLHKSGANTSPKSRHAYSVHLIDATARYPEDNWLHRSPAMPARGFTRPWRRFSSMRRSESPTLAVPIGLNRRSSTE